LVPLGREFFLVQRLRPTPVSARVLISRSRPGLFQVDAAQKQRELRRREHERVASAGGWRERSAFQTLVNNEHAVTLPNQQLHPVAAPVEEHEQIARQWILPQYFLDHAVQAVEALPHVDRGSAEENANLGGHIQHAGRSAFEAARITAPIAAVILRSQANWETQQPKPRAKDGWTGRLPRAEGFVAHRRT